MLHLPIRQLPDIDRTPRNGRRTVPTLTPPQLTLSRAMNSPNQPISKSRPESWLGKVEGAHEETRRAPAARSFHRCRRREADREASAAIEANKHRGGR